MPNQFTGHFKGTEAWIFRQSDYGSIAHIAVDPSVQDYLDAWMSGGSDTLRIDTWCGRNYKFNPDHSRMEKRNGVVRNACEYCFVEFDPEDQVGTRERTTRERATRESDLPF